MEWRCPFESSLLSVNTAAAELRIAEKLARRLGWKLWDTELTQEIARRANIKPEAAAHHDERVDPLLYRLFKVFARGSHERALPISGEQPIFRHRCMVDLLQHVIEEVARDRQFGDCGPRVALYSSESPGRLSASLCLRRSRRKCAGCARSERARLRRANWSSTIDKERGQFIKRYFGADWPCRQLYDLMINSDRGDEYVIETILNGIALAERMGAAVAAQ